MTYLQFHLVFLLPLLLLLGWRLGRIFPFLGRRAGVALPLVTAAALVYTTPWDNYLVWKGVWGYPPERVLARIGYVPVEEYLFFLLQPWLAGMLLYRLLARLPGAEPEPGSPAAVRWAGGLPLLALSAVGVWCLSFESGTYMGLILAWAGPVLAAQWLFMGPVIWRLRRAVVPAILLPTFYLWWADRFAIADGIWYISEQYTLGWDPLGLPVEEATFFLVTNVLVVFGTILFLAPGLPHLTGSPPRRRVSGGAVAAALLLVGGVVVGCGSPVPDDGSGGVASSDRTLVPGVRAGPVGATTSEESLQSRLEPGSVVRDEVPVGEGFCFPGTVLFPGTPDEVSVTWQDEARTRPAVVRVERDGGSWRTSDGVGVGTTLPELVEANGGPLVFLGFGWDYGGRVSDWLGGRLGPEREGDPAPLIVALDAPALAALPAEAPQMEFMGEAPVRSDDPDLAQLDVRVVALEIRMGPEPDPPQPCLGPDGIGTGGGSVPGAPHPAHPGG